MREIFFVSGLPRSGSTLLMNLLGQHPMVFSTPTSGCHNLLTGVKHGWGNIREHMADKKASSPESLTNVLKSILYSYHNTDKPIIVDKSRAWGNSIELIESLIGKKAKIIVPVRDICEILASFEQLYRKGSHVKPVMQHLNNTEARVEQWISPSGEVGEAYNTILDIFRRNLQDRLCLVDYDTLTTNPETTMKIIWKFLGIGSPEHDFNNVINITPEDDDVYGYLNLHKINSTVVPSEKKATTILGNDLVSKYQNLEFWKRHIH